LLLPIFYFWFLKDTIMEEAQLEQLRYPIGRFKFNSEAGISEIKKWIADIRKHPANLKKAVRGLNEKKLDTPYREGGWTIRQVVHHLADSHINAYCRVKLTLTENTPTVKPYDEATWAGLADSKLPVKVSLSLLESLHERWAVLLKRLSPEDLERKYFHPESKREVPLKELIALYSWHGKHHTAHITLLRKRMKW
jgi:uncharacterized damage-inducible protein DinB